VGNEGSIADQLAEHVRAGTRLDLIADVPTTQHGLLDADVMWSWGSDHIVPADAVRDLLLGRTISDPDPHGIRLRGARIRGRLDLDLVSTNVALALTDCLLEEGVDANEAQLAALCLHRCRLYGATRPAFSGDEMRVQTLVSFASSRLTAGSARATAQLEDAQIGGGLSFSGAGIRNDHGPALTAFGLRTEGNLHLDEGFEASAAQEHAVGLTGARIGGALDCQNSILRAGVGLALIADRMTVTHSMRLDAMRARGTVKAASATIGGRIELPRAGLVSTNGPALVLDRATVAGNVRLIDFHSSARGRGGTVRLVGAKLAGQINCAGATIRNLSGPALAADGLRLGGNALLGKGLLLDGNGPRCTVRLTGAQSVAGCTASARLSKTDQNTTVGRWTASPIGKCPSSPKTATIARPGSRCSARQPPPTPRSHTNSWPRCTGPKDTTPTSARFSCSNAATSSIAGR
jgi:hypothetical protein